VQVLDFGVVDRLGLGGHRRDKPIRNEDAEEGADQGAADQLAENLRRLGD